MITVVPSKKRILLTGDISDEMGIDFVEAMMDFSSSPDYPIEIIFLAFNGGCVSIGEAMRHCILTSPCRVNGILLGDVASMGALLFISCDYRVMSSLSTLLLHNGSVQFEDDVSSVVKLAEDIKKSMEKDYLFLSGRSDRPPKFWKESMYKKDFILHPEEALEIGLIHEIALCPE